MCFEYKPANGYRDGLYLVRKYAETLCASIPADNRITHRTRFEIVEHYDQKLQPEFICRFIQLVHNLIRVVQRRIYGTRCVNYS